MINYKYPEEKEILLHYAKHFNNKDVILILTQNQLKTSAEATQLANFFWQMVDQTVIDMEEGKEVLGSKELDSWCEYIMQTLRSHFLATGFFQEWDAESDKA